ncbi:YceI-like domain-containing protein [Dyadobacter jejuensis]|uniref:YceI-like domain-containing protein n=1 Tax=Dyadobacter jejuensis TaxID=1082580 RepID=A0A316AGQ9_9BACT|nr:YceI family protein [Dyadobacter jejuensis]PWJ56985.1 YceI-like domain-containing protein [Dyadobacter jejuensis]
MNKLKYTLHLVLVGLFISYSALGQVAAALYSTTSGNTQFSSDTPLENIQAENKRGQAVFNTKTRELAIRMNMKDFVFPNKLMQEHFNENYMESDQYPTASFRGKVNQAIDLGKEGISKVSATGTFTVHGQSQTRTLEGTIAVRRGTIIIDSSFEVQLEDHHIDVPKIVFMKIAQTIQVKAQYTLAPMNK